MYPFFCDGLTIRRLYIQTSEKKNRVFSTLTDATYFPYCKGLIKIVDCHHTVRTDDRANFRGTYTTIEEITEKESVYIKHKRYPADQ